VLGLLFLFLVGREIGHGPDKEVAVAIGRKNGRRSEETSVAGGGNGSASDNGVVAAGIKERSL